MDLYKWMSMKKLSILQQINGRNSLLTNIINAFNMKDIDKKMTLDEAIQHCHEVAESCENKECALNHEQLANWLEELKCFKNVMSDRDNSIYLK